MTHRRTVHPDSPGPMLGEEFLKPGSPSNCRFAKDSGWLRGQTNNNTPRAREAKGESLPRISRCTSLDA